jgi:1,4-dihydroxy-2-naphthoyl-CoA hydrolase
MAEDFAELLNTIRDGWNEAMGLSLVRASGESVAAELTVGPQHLQGYGIVHGGVYAGVIETAASIGAALHALPKGLSVVGLENHTSFLHAVREGKLSVEAHPLTRGRRSQLWEGTVKDAAGKLIAKGTVRLLVLEPDAELAGQKVPDRLRQA